MKKVIIAFILLNLILFSGLVSADSAEEEKTVFQEGKELLEIGFYDTGVDKIKEAIRLEPLSDEFRHSIGGLTYFPSEIPIQYLGELARYYYEVLMSQEKRAKLGVWIKKEDFKLLIYYTFENTPIYEQGIRKGDIITAIDGQEMNDSEDVSNYLKDKKPGAIVVASVTRDGVEKIVEAELVEGFINNHYPAWAVYRLIEYGMWASKAGYPTLTRQAAQKIRDITTNYPADVKYPFLDDGAVILEALATAREGNYDDAYKIALQYGKFGYHKDYIIYDEQCFAPLYYNRKKLAYLLDAKESQLPTPEIKNGKQETYVDFAGNIIKPGDEIPTLDSEKKTDNSSKEVKGTVLE